MPDEKPESSAWITARWFVVLAAGVAAILAAKPHAAGWNDGARLAAIESLGERGTLQIDDSIFTRIPTGRPTPYGPDEFKLLAGGTRDKIFLHGHFYSHHSPVPLLLGASVYKLWLLAGGPTAAEQPGRFILFMTRATAGLPYFAAVVFLSLLCGSVLHLPPFRSFLITAGFAFGTMALAYTRHVNSHVLLLGVTSAVCLLLARAESTGSMGGWSTALLGTLVGLGYGLDGVVGPALALVTVGYAIKRFRWWGWLILAMAAIPWVFAHHAISYAISGTLRPLGTVAAQFEYPGAAFDEAKLTGTSFKHTRAGFIEYTFSLLLGPKGFLSHNLPLLLAPVAVVWLWRRQRQDRIAAAFITGFAVLAVVPYALASNNYSGFCLSIRWFLPLAAPGFWALALFLKSRDVTICELSWLSVCGAILLVFEFQAGPWTIHPVRHLSALFVLGLFGWACLASSRLKVTLPPSPP